MQPRDLFGVALRVLGVWFAYLALNVAFITLLKTSAVAMTSATPVAEDKLYVAFYLALSLILLVMADHIVVLVYGTGAKKTVPAE